jgi:hypothetical protein
LATVLKERREGGKENKQKNKLKNTFLIAPILIRNMYCTVAQQILRPQNRNREIEHLHWGRREERANTFSLKSSWRDHVT